MAFKKSLTQRIFKFPKFPNQSLTNCRISSPAVPPRSSGKADIAPDPGDNGIFRRFFHKRVAAAIFDTAGSPAMQIGENIAEKLRAFDISRDRIRLAGLFPPALAKKEEKSPGLTAEDAKKLLRSAQMEVVKSRLRENERTWISYSDYVRICGDGFSDPGQAIRVAHALDESGTVIVLGNVVCLKPEQENETLLFGQI